MLNLARQGHIFSNHLAGLWADVPLFKFYLLSIAVGGVPFAHLEEACCHKGVQVALLST
jgi:hypothetical protein